MVSRPYLILGQISERQMHWLRWGVTLGWLGLIVSLFYDPISPIVTHPDTLWSPIRVNPDRCISFQGQCLNPAPYALGAPLFWGIIVPMAIFILLVLGHDIWRRICPLSFLSQVPRALGRQRHHRRVNAKTGKVRLELAKVPKNSWLARNHGYFQFSLLFLGLCGRLLVFNSHRLILGCFLLGTILAALVVGYAYGGKSWCQYFCPMAPVQKVFGEPRGLLTATAHEAERQAITQSMCRTVTPEGQEKAACVACSSPCIDIDAERVYWDQISTQQRRDVHYAYIGLAVGYFAYSYLSSGGWDYYFSGIWSFQKTSLDSLMGPGLYLFGQAIPIPKLVTVPLVLALFTSCGYGLGHWVERRYRAYCQRHIPGLSKVEAQHRVLSFGTFLVFNYFFVFGWRTVISRLPLPLQYLWTMVLVMLSTLWLYRTWHRSPQRYSRESLASRLRKQLTKLNLQVADFLEGRSLQDLTADEVYVLAKVVPGFTHEKRLRAYQAILREGLEEGLMTSVTSLDLLKNMRRELEITDKEHGDCLAAVGIDDPDLLNPSRQQNREDWLRLEGYRLVLDKVFGGRRRSAQGLGADLLAIAGGRKSRDSIQDLWLDESDQSLSSNDLKKIQQGREVYGITSEEEDKLINSLQS